MKKDLISIFNLDILKIICIFVNSKDLYNFIWPDKYNIEYDEFDDTHCFNCGLYMLNKEIIIEPNWEVNCWNNYWECRFSCSYDCQILNDNYDYIIYGNWIYNYLKK